MTTMNQQQHDALRLHADDGEARSKIENAVDEALSSRAEPPRLRVILSGDALPSETIAALITGLRRLRERGGAIEVAPASQAVRDALVLMGLDRVFAFPLVPDEARRPRRRFRGIAKIAAAGFVAVLAFVGHAASAEPTAGPTTDPVALLARVIERNPTLSSYQGRMRVDVAMSSFPFLHEHLQGTTYYKKPSNYEIVFDRVPSYARGFEKLFSDIGDPTNWPRRFTISYEGQRLFHQHVDAQLRMVQKVRGMIDHETVLVDPLAGTIDEIRYDYYNGGHITMTQTFTDVGGYTMISGQEVEIQIPHVRAVAHGEYSDYQTNVAIDDAVFTKKK
ncbi:MAG TPA: STAS domain-containing protein [Candidatus Limnocylindria bacterium]|nr:STAS domain-containing protein [Candidatus Limnocylindria bacterium]